MPDDNSFDEILEELVFAAMAERGLVDAGGREREDEFLAKDSKKTAATFFHEA